MESLASKLDKCVDVYMKETSHKFLRSSTNFVNNDICSENANTVKLHSTLMKNGKIIILQLLTKYLKQTEIAHSGKRSISVF